MTLYQTGMAKKLLNSSWTRAGVSYTLGSFLIRGLSIISLPVFTRLMTPHEFGTVALFTSVFTVLYSIGSVGFPYVIGNKFIDEGISKSFVGNLLVFMSIVFVLMGFLLKFILNGMIGSSFFITAFLTLLLLSNGAYSLHTEVLKFGYKVRAVIVFQLVVSVGGLVLSYILLNTEWFSPSNARIVGLYSTIIIIGMILGFRYLSKADMLTFGKDIKYALKISLPLVPHSIAIVLITQTDRIMLQNYTDAAVVANYSLAVTLGTIVMIVSNGLLQGIRPRIFGLISHDEKKVKNIFFLVSSVVFLCSLVLSILYEFAWNLLIDLAYLDGIKFVQYFILMGYAQFRVYLCTMIEHGSKKTKPIMKATLLALFINLSCNYILIPKLGIKGAVIASLFALLVQLIYHYVAVNRMKVIREFFQFKETGFELGILFLCSANILSFYVRLIVFTISLVFYINKSYKVYAYG